MKFITWNIDSLNAALTSDSARAVMSRDVLATIAGHQADVITFLETKLSAKGPTAKHIELLESYFPGYALAWVSSCEPAKKGYSGNMVLYKQELEPKITRPIIGAPEPMDCEGRMMTLEFPDFFFTSVYTPNAGDGLRRLSQRQEWDACYLKYLQALKAEKPVIATGDFNVAHREIDLAHPETNRFTAGFTDEERSGFDEILKSGFVDTFRHLHGDVTGVYTWWAQRVRTSKVNNSGWRIDYFLVSPDLEDKVLASEVIDSGPRQDHAPIYLEMDQLV